MLSANADDAQMQAFETLSCSLVMQLSRHQVRYKNFSRKDWVLDWVIAARN